MEIVPKRVANDGRRLWLGIGAVLAALVVVHIRYPTGLIGQASYLSATIGGAVIAMFGLRRHGVGRRWRWVAAALVLSAAGDTIFAAYSALLHLDSPSVSWADPPWLLSYVALGAGISGILGLRGARSNYRNVDAVMDMAGAAIVALLIVWIFALEPTMGDTSTGLATRLLWSSYPVLDVAMLSVLVGGMLVVRHRSLSVTLLCCGVLCWLLSDFGFVLLPTTALDPTAWLDVGWMVGAALLGVAVCAGGDRQTVAVRWTEVAGGRVRLAAGIAPLMVPALLDLWGFTQAEDPNPWPLALATAALTYLAFARCKRLLQEKDRAAVELDSSERYYRTLATHASDAVVVVNRAGEILRESPTFTRLAFLRRPIVGVDVAGLPGIVEPQLVRDLITKAGLAPGELVSEEILISTAANGDQWLSLRMMDLVEDANIGGVVINIRDVTERKQVEEELRTQAFHDSLTGLANRALFRDRVGHVLENRGRTGLDPAVAFIDLDEFKYVNDTLGHEAGDQLLRAVADRLVLVVRPGDTVARLGGDEFAVLIESRNSGADAPTVAERVLATLRQPIEILGRPLVISCSVGIAYANARSDTSSLLRHADMAMYEAKSNGKGCWALYDPAMGEASRERMNLEGDLHDALRHGQFNLVYQPIVTLTSGELSGFEALLRWNHPTLGPIAPDRFVPILEGNGSIVEVGAWVLETACRTVAGWMHDRRTRAIAPSIAVNVSSVQLAHPGFVALVERVLATTGLEPATLVLEITESSLISDPTAAALRLRELHAIGVRLAIDDFGTGYSSLSYLRQFPTDILKIDSSFVQTIKSDEVIPALVKGILDLAHTLGIETVAEGIENLHQLAHLETARCDKGQGYFLSRPLRAVAAHELLMVEAAGLRTRAHAAGPVTGSAHSLN